MRILKERNALPAVCGRVCPQEEQCEASCVLAKKGEAVAIGRLERFLGDTDLACELDHRCVPEVAAPSGFRCAVIGSGPAGLACAGELAQLGHDATIFESLHAPGGVLSYGIPEFRLPKDIVNAEIDMLGALGVKIVTNTVVGQLAEPTKADIEAFRTCEEVLSVLSRDRPASTETSIGVFAPGVEQSPEVEALLIRRRDARASKDFKASDEIRDQLAALGYAIKDMAGGKVEVKRKA